MSRKLIFSTEDQIRQVLNLKQRAQWFLTRKEGDIKVHLSSYYLSLQLKGFSFKLVVKLVLENCSFV